MGGVLDDLFGGKWRGSSLNKKSSMYLHDVAESIYAHVDEEINNNPECKALESENRKLGREMMELLGSSRTVFIDYEKVAYLMESYRVESAYNRGLRETFCQGQYRPTGYLLIFLPFSSRPQ